ncbi:hypothetical protein [Burkholderia gladioli]|uniref:hypothetical protein n=1 Tax=Burkholderia gladioli TaxID=28095 RepID=UPI00163F3262|nr:hypothetical protein [Burkholderia gladioli]
MNASWGATAGKLARAPDAANSGLSCPLFFRGMRARFAYYLMFAATEFSVAVFSTDLSPCNDRRRA